MVIDTHTHIFPDALAPKAIASLQLTAKVPVMFDGTEAGLLSLLKEEGVEKACVLNTATNAHQVDKVNAFAVSVLQHENGLLPFCSIHPETPEPKKKLREYKDAGLKGLKIHPDYVRTAIDDDSFKPILAAATEEGIPVVIHAGFDPVSPNKMHATPEAILNVLKEFPGLRLIAAHLGGVNIWERIPETLCGKDIYFDTAFCCARTGCTPEAAKKIFDNHDTKKILFGSDAPWAKPSEVLELIGKLGLSEEVYEDITHRNAERLLGI